ncbi:MAG: biotin synthase BioB [Actinobacteria bacterium]|nr:biotin synthase BioB [Actinomycetota bacterium]
MPSGITFEEALELTKVRERPAILDIVRRAGEVRRAYRGNSMDLCSIVNARSGKCEEDCAFCAQSAHNSAHVDVYPMMCVDKILSHARAAEEAGAHRFCIVTRGRSLTGGDFETALRATERIARETSLQRCASLGILDEEQAQALKSAGLSRYNHNLETAMSYYDKICRTHKYPERVGTVRALKKAGIETCVGGILNMGETERQRIEFAFELKAMEVDSVPINFLNPRPGTPMFARPLMEPLEAVKYLAIFRLIMPEPIIRIAGGRAESLGELQSLGIEAGVDGLLIGNYLTTIGIDPDVDLKMLHELGFECARK